MRRLFAAALCVVALGSACGDDAEPTVGESAVERAIGPAQVRYADDYPQQYGFLTVPPGEGPHPVIVFIHGGFWRNGFDTMLADPQAADAVAEGYAAWNIEYRRVGDPDGGYPGTLEDVAAAVDLLPALASEYPLDLDRVAVVGHSAGGHLALWVGQRGNLPAGSAGSAPAVVPRLVVGQAPVADLQANLDLGRGAVADLIGGLPDELPDDYAVADPAALLPIVVPQLIVQGSADDTVPPDRAEAYATRVAAEGAGADALRVEVFDGADHFDVIDPTHESWRVTLTRIATTFSDR